MKKRSIAILLLTCIFLSACGKKSENKPFVTSNASESQVEAPNKTEEIAEPEAGRHDTDDDYDYTEYIKENFQVDSNVAEAIAGEEFDKLSPQTQILVVRLECLATTLYALGLIGSPAASDNHFVKTFLSENPEYVLLIAHELDPLVAPKGTIRIPDEKKLNKLQEIVDEILEYKDK